MKKHYTTVERVLAELKGYKPISRKTLYVYLRTLEIRPLSEMRQRPQLYPADTTKRILKGLGFK